MDATTTTTTTAHETDGIDRGMALSLTINNNKLEPLWRPRRNRNNGLIPVEQPVAEHHRIYRRARRGPPGGGDGRSSLKQTTTTAGVNYGCGAGGCVSHVSRIIRDPLEEVSSESPCHEKVVPRVDGWPRQSCTFDRAYRIPHRSIDGCISS